MAVGSATQPKPKIMEVAGQAVKDVADGAMLGSTSDHSLLRTAGDIAASCIPGMSEANSLRDVYQGIREGDAGKLIGGIIGLIPVAGGAAKAVGATGKKVAAKVSKDVTQKGVTVAAQNLTRLAQVSAKKAMNDPRLKKHLAKAGEAAYARTLEVLQDRLQTMLTEGKMPTLITREHGDFIDARKAMFSELGIQHPDASWQSLFVEGEDGKKRIVGKHKPEVEPGSIDELYSALGFRFVDGGDDKLNMMWWRRPENGGDHVFGIESAQVSPEAKEKLLETYLQQSKSFRTSRKSA